MLLSAMDMDRPLTECSMVDILLPSRGYASSTWTGAPWAGYEHQQQDWSLLLKGGKAHRSLDLNKKSLINQEKKFT